MTPAEEFIVIVDLFDFNLEQSLKHIEAARKISEILIKASDSPYAQDYFKSKKLDKKHKEMEEKLNTGIDQPKMEKTL